MARKRSSKLKDWFVPHRGNYYKPAFFSTASVAGVLLVLVILQGAYIASTQISFFRGDFLASVLPGALVSLANDDRASAGVGTLTEDALLAQAAQLKADDMALKGYFSHVAPDGTQPWHWFDQVGYPYTYAGENLAVDFTDSKDVENAWMASPTHHANLVKQQYTHIGIGVAQGTYKGKETTFVVQFFATRSDAGKVAVAEVKPQALSAPKTATPAPVEDTVADAKKAAAPADAAPTPEFREGSSTVLGAEVSPAEATGFLSAIATSPSNTWIFILSALIVLVSILLIIAIFVKVRVQYREVIGGGLVLLLVLLALLIYAKSSRTPVQLPGDTQTAAVYNAL